MNKSTGSVIFVVMAMLLVGSTFLAHARRDAPSENIFRKLAGDAEKGLARKPFPDDSSTKTDSDNKEPVPEATPVAQNTNQGEPFDPPLKINGSFLQYQARFLDQPESFWIDEIKNFEKMKISSIYIQWVRYGKTRFYSDIKNIDPTETILSYADKNNISVFVGTQFDEKWWDESSSEEYLNSVLKKDLKFAKTLWKRYGKHKSFVGWYIPYEMSDGDFDLDEISQYNNFLKSYAQGLKAICPMNPKIKVAFSTFFSKNLTGEQVEKVYEQVFKNVKLDQVLVQDGIGVHKEWADQMSENVKPYFAAFQKACTKNKIQMLPVLEIFETEKGSDHSEKRIPAKLERIRAQLILSQSMGFSQNIVFDAFHYLSPGRGDAEKKVFEQYVQDCAQDEQGCRF